MKTLTLLIMLLLTLCSSAQLIYKGQSFAFVGPMLHFNIGNGQTKVSLGIEASYWRVIEVDAVLAGADLGIDYEFGTKKLRIYTEAQAGSGMGLSLGPVLDIQDGQHSLGAQGSAWVALIGGIDIRWRKTDHHYLAPGMMFKLPLIKM